jgi:glutathionylspermidine synthase
MLDASGNIASAEYIRNCMDHDIKRCMKDVLKAALPKLTRKHGYFDLLGFDFMMTATNELKLLEVNTNPAMSLDNSTLEGMLPNIIDGTIQIVLDTQVSFCSLLENRNHLISYKTRAQIRRQC